MYIVTMIITFTIGMISIPLIIKFSHDHKIYDYVDERKIHSENISRLGGLGFFIAFFIGFIIIFLLNKNNPLMYKDMKLNFNFNIYIYLFGMLLSFGVGFIDDLKNVRYRIKLFIQILCGVLVFFAGLRFDELRILGIDILKTPYISFFVTVGWVVGFMNAINLIDGLDGLSSGIIIISNIFIIIISIIIGNLIGIVIPSLIILSIIGFYIFNFPPAKIFMGDGGAYFLGFMYSTISLMGIKKSSIAIMFIIPLVLLIVPLVDILQVILKRVKLRKSIFHADKNHIHHKLLELKLPHRSILVIIYSFSIIMGFFSVLMVLIDKKYSNLLFILIFLIVFLGLYILNIIEKHYFKK